MSVSDQLYLHEIIDIVGANSWPYMRHTLDAAGDEKVNFRLQGTWSVMGITGRWPQVVNLWDIPGGWEGWREAVDRLNLKRPSNQDLERWWAIAYEMRSGGFDRLLRGAPGSPTTDELVTQGVRGTLFVHEIAEVRPGTAPEYLAAVNEHRAPLLAEYGHSLTGLFETQFTDTEVVVMWATDVDSHVQLQSTDDERLTGWQRAAREFVVRWKAELMTPCPGTPIGPHIDG